MPFTRVNGKWLMVNGDRAKKSIHYSPFTIHDKSAGFTLIEILIFLLVVFALVTILLASTGSLRHSRNVNLTTVAAEIAICEVERLRDLSFSTLPANGTAAIGAPCNADVAKLPLGATANITIANYQADPDIKQITITVSWTEKGTPDSIQIETLKSKYGV